MTTVNDIENDPRYIKVLNSGFVGVVDHMGSDAAIVQAARVSYGDGTKSVREDRALIRYLVRHKHTSPLEMVEVCLHIKTPIFVMRQLVRHRTANLNEYSGRYSVMTDEFYIPELENIKPQSTDNKQGRNGQLSACEQQYFQSNMKTHCQISYDLYQKLLEPVQYGIESCPEGDPAGVGMARELARTILPLSNYTELYWKQDLHNLFNMLRLRSDSHAQWEIQEYARAIYDLIQPLFPEACGAYEDYIRDSATLSSMEIKLMRDLLEEPDKGDIQFRVGMMIKVNFLGDQKAMLAHYRLTKRELDEFIANWK
jgi:thymidylate synthase (FAD)